MFFSKIVFLLGTVFLRDLHASCDVLPVKVPATENIIPVNIPIDCESKVNRPAPQLSSNNIPIPLTINNYIQCGGCCDSKCDSKLPLTTSRTTTTTSTTQSTINICPQCDGINDLLEFRICVIEHCGNDLTTTTEDNRDECYIKCEEYDDKYEAIDCLQNCWSITTPSTTTTEDNRDECYIRCEEYDDKYDAIDCLQTCWSITTPSTTTTVSDYDDDCYSNCEDYDDKYEKVECLQNCWSLSTTSTTQATSICPQCDGIDDILEFRICVIEQCGNDLTTTSTTTPDNRDECYVRCEDYDKYEAIECLQECWSLSTPSTTTTTQSNNVCSQCDNIDDIIEFRKCVLEFCGNEPSTTTSTTSTTLAPTSCSQCNSITDRTQFKNCVFKWCKPTPTTPTPVITTPVPAKPDECAYCFNLKSPYDIINCYAFCMRLATSQCENTCYRYYNQCPSLCSQICKGNNPRCPFQCISPFPIQPRRNCSQKCQPNRNLQYYTCGQYQTAFIDCNSCN